MKYIYIAIFVLGAFVAIWMFFVVPAERRHHERKIELVRKKIERRAEQSTAVDGTESDSKDGDSG
jgi:predicted MFS family arabinose efflux permease